MKKETVLFISAFSEGCLWVASAQVVLWVLIFASFSLDLLVGVRTEFVIWGFKMGYSGSFYMLLVPLLHAYLKIPLRIYHWISMIIGCYLIISIGNAMKGMTLIEATFLLFLPIILTTLGFVIQKPNKENASK